MKKVHHKKTKKQKPTAGDPRNYAKDIVAKEKKKLPRLDPLNPSKEALLSHGYRYSKITGCWERGVSSICTGWGD